MAQVRYENGFSIDAQGPRVQFKEPVAGAPRNNYEVHAFARRYLEATRLVSYNAIGINWVLAVDTTQAPVWLKDFMAAAAVPKGFTPVSIQLVEQFSSANLSMTCKLAPERKGGAVDYNFHFPLDSQTDALNILSDWNRYQTHMVSTIQDLLSGLSKRR